jgi:hypothetical protein
MLYRVQDFMIDYLSVRGLLSSGGLQGQLYSKLGFD